MERDWYLTITDTRSNILSLKADLVILESNMGKPTEAHLEELEREGFIVVPDYHNRRLARDTVGGTAADPAH